MNAIGLDGDKLDVVLIQLVRLVKGGEVVRMSKRTGKAIQLGDLLDEVPVDAARFYFNMREATSQMDFDLDLAVQQDSQNPVYYVQYARARICSIIKALAAEGINPRSCGHSGLMSLELNAPAEDAVKFINHLHLFEIGCSWGGFESLALTPFYHCSNEELEFLHLTESRGLIRLHCGLEGTENLICDLDQALEQL